MIFLTAPGGRLRVVVIDTDEHGQLKAAHPLLTPDKSIMLAWTPDPVWLLERIRMRPGTAQDIARTIDQAARRPQASALLGPDGLPLPSPQAEESKIGPDYSAAVNELLRLWPVANLNDIGEYMAATFIPAILAAKGEA